MADHRSFALLLLVVVTSFALGYIVFYIFVPARSVKDLSGSAKTSLDAHVTGVEFRQHAVSQSGGDNESFSFKDEPIL